MRQQYGLRVQSEEFAGMRWDEFFDLLAGLSADTPLVKVAQIRTEEDPEAVKQMTPAQRRMRAEWQRRRALKRPEAETRAFVKAMQDTFARMCAEGGGDRT